MKKVFKISALTTFMVMVYAAVTAAAETAAPTVAAVAGGAADSSKAIVVVASIVVAGMTMAIGTITTALGMGNGLAAAANAVGRNPEAQGKVLITMMVGLAMIESLAIYTLVIALVLIYANPLVKLLGL
ncbi:MAG: ATP synthase F0 subunit C [Syntrophales bacterium]|jgi:F-type H+-transporting ATPase subunit c|nr:ATP synthase F0 subunit C [Syntrophales bacterium]